MKSRLLTLAFVVALSSCGTNTRQNPATSQPAIIGTWQLITGTLIEKGDTVVTDYTKGRSFIKVINNTHFAFMLHDLKDDADTTSVFASGGGRYTLADSTYTEHLEYCTDRQWEGHDFAFTVTIANDTLVQRGIEKVESAGVDRLNEERYLRVR